MSNAADDFLDQSGAPTLKFPTIGTTHRGKVLAYELQQQRDIKSNEPLTYSSGDPRMQIVFTLQTDERDPENSDDDGKRRLFAKGYMLGPIKTAMSSVPKGQRLGGVLAVKYYEDGEPSAAGFNAPKFYQAKFTAADPLDAVDDFDAPPSQQGAAALVKEHRAEQDDPPANGKWDEEVF